MTASTTIDFGNRTITVTVTPGKVWEKNGSARRYFDISVDGKANPLHSFYEVLSGTSRDETVSASGRSFGFVYGFCDSKTKRKAAAEAAANLAAQISAGA